MILTLSWRTLRNLPGQGERAEVPQAQLGHRRGTNSNGVGTNGVTANLFSKCFDSVSTNGVTANFMFFDRGTSERDKWGLRKGTHGVSTNGVPAILLYVF